jgi:hypothetical protein
MKLAHQSDRIMLLTIDEISDIDGYWDIQNKSDDTVVDGIYQRLIMSITTTTKKYDVKTDCGFEKYFPFNITMVHRCCFIIVHIGYFN